MTSYVLSNYMQIFLRRRWFVLGFAAVVLATVGYVSYSTTPVYRATALVLIEKEQSNMYSNSREAVMVESSQQDYYQTQYSILQSRALAQNTLAGVPQLDTDPQFRNPGDRVNQFLKGLTIEPLLNTRLVKVHFDSTQPAMAAKIVNTLADRYVRQNQANRLFISKDILSALEPRPRAPRSKLPFSPLPDYESLPSVVNNKLIQELKTDFARLEAQRADLSQRYTPKHPSMKQLDSQIAQLRMRIDTEVRKIAQAVKAELSGQLQGNNIRIIDRAEVPTRPIRPQPVLNMALGAFFGLLVGFLLALLIDHLDSTVKDPDDIEKHVKVPFLGAIPYIPRLRGRFRKQNPYLYSYEAPNTLMAEAFRNIRASLVFAGLKPPKNGLLITSTIAGEGKTFVACNLAMVFAQLGERVLLVDGDLRKPQLHTLFNLPVDKGLSSYIVSHDDPVRYVSPSGIPGLHVMVSGPTPGNPAELLSHRRLQAFFTWALQEFDRVIVDGPPAVACSDSLLLSKIIKNTLVVIQSGKTNTDWASRVCRKLKHSAEQTVWAVVNQARWGLSRYHYYSATPEIAEVVRDKGAADRRRLIDSTRN